MSRSIGMVNHSGEPPGWLDFVLALPAIGVRGEPEVLFPEKRLSDLTTLASRWVKDGVGYNVRATDANLGQIVVDSGSYRYLVNHHDSVVESIVSGRLHSLPGSRPTVVYERGEPTPFSELLPSVLARTIELTAATSRADRRVDRIGVVASVRVSNDAMPPGIDAIYDRLSASLGGRRLSIMKTTCLVPLGENEQCLFGLDVNEVERPGEVQLRIDWQRLFPKEKVTVGSLKDPLETAAVKASTFFEQLGMGEVMHVAE